MKIQKIFIIMVLCIVISISHSCKSNSTLVTFKGGTITENEVITAGSSELFEIQEQEYQIKRGVAYKLAKDKVVALEAKQLKKTPETLVDEYVQKNYQPVVEEMAKDYYLQNKDRIQQPYESIKVELMKQMNNNLINEAQQQYYQELFKKYDVKLTLQEPMGQKVNINVQNDPYWGPENAKVVVVEYSDFECPYCQRIQSDIHKIRGEYKDKIKWVFKDFPLSFHAQAKLAHIAANCAHQQNKFFDFQYSIFDSNENLKEENLYKVAINLGLNISDFKTCIQDKDASVVKEIETDIEEGVKNGVKGTPTLFVNGKKQKNFRDYTSMKAVLDAELQSK